MPISLREYKEELVSEDSRILAILERQPYQAYSLADLVAKTDNLVLAILQTFALQSIVNRLIQKGLVKSKDVRGMTYYASSKAV